MQPEKIMTKWQQKIIATAFAGKPLDQEFYRKLGSHYHVNPVTLKKFLIALEAKLSDMSKGIEDAEIVDATTAPPVRPTP